MVVLDLSMEEIKEDSILQVKHKLAGVREYKYLKLAEKESETCAGWHYLQCADGLIIEVENEWFRQREWKVKN